MNPQRSTAVLNTRLAYTASEVAGAATETRGSAETVLATSETVEKAADDLRVEVEGFLEKVAV